MSTSGPDEVHALIARTNDGAIAMEGSRIWVNAVRVLSRRDASDTASETPWRALCTPAIAGDLCGMISRGEKYLALVAEGVVALTLLVAFGGMGAEVADALMRDPNPAGVPQQDKGKEARVPAMALAGVLAPTPERPVSAEVQANTIALLKLLPRGPLGELVRSEIKAAREAGRAVAPGVEMLDE
jgi:hypothetical protein